MSSSAPSSAPWRRAVLLLQQGRADLAEPELRRALVDNPNDPDLHAVLALTLADLDRAAEALPEAERAIGLAPDVGIGHYARSVVLLRLDRAKDATEAAREALRLDPSDVEARVTLAAALLDLRKREEALAVAEEALALDPENAGAANLRALALVKLGRRDEAAATVEGVLSRDPDNAVSHANQGWTLLHQGREREAMEAFREALRLEPNNEWARSGILEAMKARNVVYRGLLRYFLWMDRLSTGQRWGVIIGGYLLARVFPPLLVVYLPAVLLTWAGNAFFNLVLFLDPFGRLVLTRDERIGASLVGVCVLGGATLGIGGLAVGDPNVAAIGAGLLGLSLPVGGTFNRPPERRRIASLYTAAVVIVGLGAVFAFYTGRVEAAQSLAGFYVLGVVGFTWLGNLFTR